MRDITFEPPLSGQFFAVSPNSCLVALVKHGVSVNIVNHTHTFSSGATPRSRAPDPEDDGVPPSTGGRGRGSKSGTEARTEQQARKPNINRYKALDQISGIAWAPDSSMIAIWMRHRGAIEVVDAHTVQCVARIDGGLDGITTCTWHPSSRALYYYGRSSTHIASLVDGSTMELAHGVKLAQIWEYTNELLRLDSKSGMAMAQGLDPSTTAGCVLRPLQQFSPCKRFVFAVSPLQNDDSSDAVVVPSSRDQHQPAVISLEAINVFDTTSHELLSSIIIGSLVPKLLNVTEFHTTAYHFVVFDRFAKIAAIIPHSGAEVSAEVHGVRSVDVNTGSNSVSMNREEDAIVYVCVGKRFFAMAPLPLRPLYLPRLTPVLTERRPGGGAPSSVGSVSNAVSADVSYEEPSRSTAAESRSKSAAHTNSRQSGSNASAIPSRTSASGPRGRSNVSNAAPNEPSRSTVGTAATADAEPAGGSVLPGTASYRLDPLGSIAASVDSFRYFSELALSTRATKSLFYESFAKHYTRQAALLRDGVVGESVTTEDIAKREFAFLKFHNCSMSAASTSGEFAALVTQAHPSVVFVVAVKTCEVHTVVRHDAVVTGLSWSPRYVTEGTQSRAIPAALAEKAGGGSGAMLNPRNDALMIFTDNHEGHVFMWQPTKASVISVPSLYFGDFVGNGESHAQKEAEPMTDKERAAKNRAAARQYGRVQPHVMQPLRQPSALMNDRRIGFRVNRVCWGRGSSCLLCDDMRGAAVTAYLGAQESD